MNFYRDLLRCEACSGSTLSIRAIVVIVLAVAVLASLVFAREQVSDMLRLVDFGKLRVLYVTGQIVTTIPKTLAITLPEPARTLVSTLELTFLNPFDTFSFACMHSGLGSYDTKLYATMAGVLVICLGNWAIYGVRVASSGAKSKIASMYSQHMSAFLIFTYLFYPSLSLMQFNGFTCTNYDGLLLLDEDLSIECNSEKYQRLAALNIMFIVLTQSIPGFYYYRLWRVKAFLQPPSSRSKQSQLRARSEREHSKELKPLVFLFKHYDLKWWHFEVIESWRRVCLVSLLQLVPDKDIAGFIGMLFAIFSWSLYERGQPYITS